MNNAHQFDYAPLLCLSGIMRFPLDFVGRCDCTRRCCPSDPWRRRGSRPGGSEHVEADERRQMAARCFEHGQGGATSLCAPACRVHRCAWHRPATVRIGWPPTPWAASRACAATSIAGEKASSGKMSIVARSADAVSIADATWPRRTLSLRGSRIESRIVDPAFERTERDAQIIARGQEPLVHRRRTRLDTKALDATLVQCVHRHDRHPMAVCR